MHRLLTRGREFSGQSKFQKAYQRTYSNGMTFNEVDVTQEDILVRNGLGSDGAFMSWSYQELFYIFE